MEVQITLQREDWSTYQSYITKALPRKYRTWMDSFWANTAILTIFAIVFMLIFRRHNNFHWPTAISTGIFFSLLVALFFFNLYKIRKAFVPQENGIFCGTHKFTFSDEGIASEGKGYVGHHSWEIVHRIEREQGMILIYLDTAYAYVFPESKLADPDGFYRYVSERYSISNNKFSS